MDTRTGSLLLEVGQIELFGVSFREGNFMARMSLQCLFLTVAVASISFRVLHPQETHTRRSD